MGVFTKSRMVLDDEEPPVGIGDGLVEPMKGRAATTIMMLRSDVKAIIVRAFLLSQVV